MKYPVWFLRLLFAAWMIPAGLNHFIPIFPQPMGNQPLSQELIHALIDSHLFDLVKAVELYAGVAVLVGFYTPLALLVCLPVSFGVFYWDAPLEGWGSRAALFGYATLLVNALLCLAYWKNYRSMFGLKAATAWVDKQTIVLGMRLVLGAFMVLYGANYLWLGLWNVPAGGGPLASQLMTALVNSHLLDVAMALQTLAGLLLLANLLVPAALYVLMPIASCALFWALILDHQLSNVLLSLVAFVLNAALMFAYLPQYKGVLERRALSLGEQAGTNANFDDHLVDPRGRSTWASFTPALVVVAVAVAFFLYYVTGRTAQFCALTLMYPAFVLLTRRVRDSAYSPWLVLLVLLPTLAGFAYLLDYI